MKDKVVTLVQGNLYTLTKAQKSNILFSSEATGKHSTFRFLETGRQGGIFELDQYKETCAGIDSKDRVSEHEEHKPSIHDEGLPFFVKDVWNYSRVLNVCT